MGTTTSKRPHDTTPTSTKVGAVQPASSTSPGRTNPVLGRSSDDGTEGSGDGVSTNVASGGAGGGSTAGGGTEPAPLKREDSTLAEQRALATDALSDGGYLLSAGLLRVAHCVVRGRHRACSSIH